MQTPEKGGNYKNKRNINKTFKKVHTNTYTYIMPSS